MMNFRVSGLFRVLAVMLPVVLSSCGILAREDHDFSKGSAVSGPDRVELKWTGGAERP